MNNTFNPQLLKKLLLAIGLSILLIIIFLILRVFLDEEKDIRHNSFTKSISEKLVQEEKKEIKEEEKKLLLLPSKD